MSDGTMTLPRHAHHTGGARPAGDRRPRPLEPLVLFSVTAFAYLLTGWAMIHFNVVFGDAISRVANASYVLFSRDPHLPAIGFVWNPLPSFALLPVLPLKSLLPALVTHGAAGVLQSALSMAGTVVVLSGCLRKLGVRRTPRLVLVAVVAFQPMIVLYAGSGLSEPMLLLFLSLAASALISWIQRPHPGHLVAAGLALALAYLTRYEAVAPAAAVTALVAATTAIRGPDSRSHRFRMALNDAALVATPFLFAFLFWAASARILVGQWFPTFSSQYGNSFQVSSAAQRIEQATGDGPGEILLYLGRQTMALAPLLAAVLIVAAVLATRRRNLGPLILLAVFGSVMAFTGLALLAGASFGWLRFQITIIPLTALLAGAAIGMLSSRTTGQESTPTTERAGRHAMLGTTAVLLAVSLAIPVQARVLVDPTLELAREEAPLLGSLFFPDRPSSDPSWLRRYLPEREIAQFLDRRDPGEGTVLVDSAYGYAIITNSTNPRTFVITSDRDFRASVDDPRAHGIKYILVQSDKPADVVRVRWPTIFADGAGFATLHRSWTGTHGQWRLYAVN